MPLNLIITLLLPIAIKIIEKYVYSSESKKDDEVLKIVKVGAKYLANKDNNNLPYYMENVINKIVMKNNN